MITRNGVHYITLEKYHFIKGLKIDDSGFMQYKGYFAFNRIPNFIDLCYFFQKNSYPEPGFVCNNLECWKRNQDLINRIFAIEILMKLEIKKWNHGMATGMNGKDYSKGSGNWNNINLRSLPTDKPIKPNFPSGLVEIKIIDDPVKDLQRLLKKQ
jgi:hypothetical protein